jgi:hypothetical protein
LPEMDEEPDIFFLRICHLELRHIHYFRYCWRGFREKFR